MEWYKLTIKQIALYDKKILNDILNEMKFFNKFILSKIDIGLTYYNQILAVLNNEESSILNIPITFEDVYVEYEQLINKNTSHQLFPEHLIILYPNIKTYKASKPITCSFSGEIINSGSEYIYYRPLIQDLTTNSVYIITPTIKTTSSYQQYLPKNIQELEEFHNNLTNSYQNNNSDIDFYDVSCNMKCDGFKTLKLKRPRN